MCLGQCGIVTCVLYCTCLEYGYVSSVCFHCLQVACLRSEQFYRESLYKQGEAGSL